MSKHTPELQKADPGFWKLIYDAGHPLVVDEWGSVIFENDTMPERFHRLIAAAPETAAELDSLKAINAELLAALENLHEMTGSALPHVSSEWSRRGAPDGNHMEMSVAMENARAAIAKAKEGGS